MRRPEEVETGGESVHTPDSQSTEDEEVAEWVKIRLERRRQGLLRDVEKPALHAVALDAVPGSPLLDDPSSITLNF